MLVYAALHRLWVSLYLLAHVQNGKGEGDTSLRVSDNCFRLLSQYL